ncbi:MAG: hypothetical protein H0U23_02095 [Blastocatellia bacterium]|nr:hypothetical protein [Blastocatellia bacterium]
MNDFLAYHNPEKMGERAIDLEVHAVLTKKEVPRIIGDRVWLVTGEGSPRKYYLCDWFIVDRIETIDDPYFRKRISGRAGNFIRPMRRLDEHEWFPDFKRSNGNFGLGFQPINEVRFIKALEKIAGGLSRGRVYN